MDITGTVRSNSWGEPGPGWSFRCCSTVHKCIVLAVRSRAATRRPGECPLCKVMLRSPPPPPGVILGVNALCYRPGGWAWCLASKWRCWHFTHSLTQNPSSVCLPLSTDDSLFPRHWFSWSVSLERASPIGMSVFWECGGGEPLSSPFLVLLPALRDLMIKGCPHTKQGSAFVSSFRPGWGVSPH